MAKARWTCPVKSATPVLSPVNVEPPVYEHIESKSGGIPYLDGPNTLTRSVHNLNHPRPIHLVRVTGPSPKLLNIALSHRDASALDSPPVIAGAPSG
jgi:hypothetical protein